MHINEKLHPASLAFLVSSFKCMQRSATTKTTILTKHHGQLTSLKTTGKMTIDRRERREGRQEVTSWSCFMALLQSGELGDLRINNDELGGFAT